jgi:hypothetical protein
MHFAHIMVQKEKDKCQKEEHNGICKEHKRLGMWMEREATW